MRAQGERQVPIRRAPDVQSVRLGKLIGIAIRGADTQMDLRPGRQ